MRNALIAAIAALSATALVGTPAYAQRQDNGGEHFGRGDDGRGGRGRGGNDNGDFGGNRGDRGNQVARLVTKHAQRGRANQRDSRDDHAVLDETLSLLIPK